MSVEPFDALTWAPGGHYSTAPKMLEVLELVAQSPVFPMFRVMTQQWIMETIREAKGE